MKPILRLFLGLTLLASFTGGGLAWYFSHKEPANAWRTARVRRGDVVQTIAATGTIVPEDVVDVGAQVNGMIAAFGKDADGKIVDYRSNVAEGALLARIDDSIYKADVATAQAQLSSSEAQVRFAESSREVAIAKRDQADRDWSRAQMLGSSKALAQADYDAARSNEEQAKANVAVAEATIGQAKAAVAMAKAALDRSRQNLNYCTIESPVNGVIIDRRVDVGQTVVASLNAPSLFLIAKDLKRMQVLVQVNEADIGHVHPQQKVAFTVDAHPGETFRGEVRKIRLNATMTQNVVTYTVEIATDNADLKLLPYLTANVVFEVARRDGVLTVPNTALRWAPREAGAASEPAASGPASSAVSSAAWRRGAAREGKVWILADGALRPVVVKMGIADAAQTEIESAELREGSEVVIGEAGGSAPARAGDTTNPFAPQMFGNRAR